MIDFEFLPGLQYDGSNMPFKLWKAKVRNMLYATSCFEAVTPGFVRKDERGNLVASKEERKTNGLASSIIINSLSDSLANKLCGCTAAETWSAMHTMFEFKTTGPLITELRDLLNLKMASDDENPVDYWIASVCKWEAFPMLELSLRHVALLVALAGLSPKYASVRDKFANVDPTKLNDEEILRAIKDAHRAEKVLRSRGLNRPAAATAHNAVCQLCETPGHLAPACPMLTAGIAGVGGTTRSGSTSSPGHLKHRIGG
ncbi:hypothetical protein GQ54DRAFT_299728 [Martensiomyces pterosporus]|nr:hypothetical protein GQ54DRAFT_299728 [Martensiomyces pterosporus]